MLKPWKESQQCNNQTNFDERQYKNPIKGSFLSWIHLLHNDPQSCRLTNRLGGPLSPLLFNIALEMLATQIKGCVKI
uniref:Reverse transcriptase domain-containing protein n=1 Tax=Chrysemys picta bellii TaxID=8478 RepID=A0A8C3I350_CHRPI